MATMLAPCCRTRLVLMLALLLGATISTRIGSVEAAKKKFKSGKKIGVGGCESDVCRVVYCRH